MPRYSAAAIAVLLATRAAFGGWVSIKNDTTQPIVVQETTVVNNQVRKGKPIKLLPGEVLREFQPAAGAKTFLLSEPGLFGKSLGKADLTWKADDAAYVIRPEPAGVKVAAVKSDKPTVVAVGGQTPAPKK